MKIVETQLEKARQSLLDLSMRNRLLNYRPTNQKTIRVVNEIPREVFNRLVLQEKTMEFRPKEEQISFSKSDYSSSEVSILVEDCNKSILLSLPHSEKKLESRLADHFLQTTFDKENLDRKLLHVSQQSRTVLEEQGYTVLFLALGYLEWFESQSSEQSRRAPLILVPVELERKKIRTIFKLHWTGEDIQSNISLQAKLTEQGINLPELELSEEKSCIDDYFQLVEEAISSRSKWKIYNDIYLDFFSFTKFVMFKDLDPAAWPEGKSPANHPLIQAILSPNSKETNVDEFSEDEVDRKLRAHDIYHVMDADPSQIAVIEDVKSGKNLVVEGPPGTGKSQTITNIIAELLAMGKSVLFVSEKMAALEVVKNRLDQVGLGDFCMEIHSRKANKREVLKEIERSLLQRSFNADSNDKQYDQIENLKKELNSYAEALREPFGELKYSPFKLFCLKEKTQQHFKKSAINVPRIKLSNPESCTSDDWASANSKLIQLAEIVSLVQPLSDHPWSGCQPIEVFLPNDIEEIKELLEDIKRKKKKLEDALNHLHQTFNIKQVEKLVSLELSFKVNSLTSILRLLNRNYRILRNGLRIIKKDFLVLWNELVSVLCFEDEIILGKSIEEAGFLDIEVCIDHWLENLNKLTRWSQFCLARKSFLQTIAKPMISIIDEGKIDPKDFVPCFESNFADSLLQVAFKSRPELLHFVSEVHEEKIDRFRDLDQRSLEWNRQRVAHRLYMERPHLSSGSSPGSEAGILLSEINKKRRHMPIRKLFLHAGGLIQKIKPCFMMSPLSVAQFLDPKSTQFDVIIFDEASQVKPEDSLGALLRGGQVVVTGDTQQLPPTSFFDHLIEDIEDEEYTTSISDAESILRQCKKSFPTKMLRWHYRSRHESLIAVSNQEFYDNRLLIYPSPNHRDDQLGLQFIHFSDSVYDRGRSAVNRKEAQAVAKAAVEHYKLFPNKSLGVGTFNTKQQQAILEEIELQLRGINPEIEDCFSSNLQEHFFVKNLETIQGDERDVIFLSVGFGFEANGRFSRNFGPLNKEGGERRLNVLITRAREKCVVFSNFRASDLLVDNKSPFGLRAFKTFLDYAENRRLSSSLPLSEDSDSPFEDSVYEFLKSNNYEVHKQIGCAGFRIDLGIVDLVSPGRYLLGIECDGAKYHSSSVARDRDRLRQQILERLGWRIHRIWSTDWYRNRYDTEQRLLKTIEKVKYDHSTDSSNYESFESNKVEISEEFNVPVSRISEEDTSKKEIINNTKENSDFPFDLLVSDYEMCLDIGILIHGEIHEQSLSDLANAITTVVKIEGPIHFDEVVKRIRDCWGLKRAGQRIKRVIESGVSFALNDDSIKQVNEFLWPKDMKKPIVRCRNNDYPAKIELICSEEIEEAIALVLRHQFDTQPKELAVQASRFLGFQTTREMTANTILKVMDQMIENGRLEHLSNGMIHLVD